MSATPALDENALEAAAIALIDHDPSMSGHHPIHVDCKRPIARAAITAYLSATSTAQSERERVLVSALQEIEDTLRNAGSDADLDCLAATARAALKAAP